MHNGVKIRSGLCSLAIVRLRRTSKGFQRLVVIDNPLSNFRPTESLIRPNLLNRDRFCQIAWFIDVKSFLVGDIISQELQRDDIN